MPICEELELAVQLDYSMREVEFDLVTVTSWIFVSDSVCWDYALSLLRVRVLTSSSTILFRHILHDVTFVVDFLANWACTHRVSQRFLHLGISWWDYLVFFI